MIYQKGKKIEKIKHIYIHTPFCIKKCKYCDFYSEQIKINFVDLYIKALIKEIDFQKEYIDYKLKSIFFGGGTPYLLGLKNLEKLLLKFKNSISKNTEISIELNPYHFIDNKKLFSDLLNIGFNRFSIGVQTFDRSILKEIARIVPKNFDEFLEKNNNLNLNIDFMFGIAKQNLNSLKNDLKNILTIKPKHISFYLFTVPEHLYKGIPNSKIQEKMYYLIKNTLKNNYNHYEVSNYAKKNYECIHNQAYWKRKTYLGFGASAHSFIKNKTNEYRYSNISSYLEYIKNPSGIKNIESLSVEEKNNEKILLGLRLLNQGLNLSFINSEISNLIKEKYLSLKGSKIYIPENKLFLIDEITSRILSD